MKRRINWTKKGRIFINDPSFDWAKTHATLPTPFLKDENTLRIYYTSRDSEQRSRISYIDTNPDNPSEILYVHKEPVLDIGHIGTFDDRGLTSSHLQRVGDDLFFYYSGYNIGVPARYRIAIGLSISKDNGQSFKKISDGPIMDRSIHNPCGSATPFIIHEDGIYKMWYASFTKWEINKGNPEPYYRIAYAESNDAINWDVKNPACIDFRDNEGGIVNPCLAKIGNVYHMWFSVRKDTDYREEVDSSYRIGYATSEDGVHWERDDENAGVILSEEGWDSEMICYPNLIRIKNKLYLFYNGNGFGKSGFGYAVADL